MTASELNSDVVNERLQALSGLHTLGMSLAASKLATTLDYRRHAVPLCGRLSERALQLCRPGLSCWPLGRDDIAIFCAVSPRTIHVGSELSTLYDATGAVVLGRAILVAVAQSWTRPLDSLPRGDKTVCVFRTTGALAPTLAALPKDDDWSNAPRCWLI